MSSQTQTNNAPAPQPALAVDTASVNTVPPEERDVELPSPISPSALDFGLRAPIAMEIRVQVEVHEVVETCIAGEVLDDFGVAREEVVSRCCATIADRASS
ncbi:hypothetical protein AURDEDRAFT_131031 [Auricularia subglabra TFB-10046 SS5]|uniref:Uncharacterized protein n=1 Tax=Auricularia subglabra (strain TFB-10046 / SS5) TaxID=717982 RepID=J0D6Y0_AURST|nr:hypothetical protein AURDEDRAFT_131031 [Auricularia subglabra TFB-10046 SS5]